MLRNLKLVVGITFALTLFSTGVAEASGNLGESTATARFDRLGVRYQRHLTKDSHSHVTCQREGLNSFRCRAKWKVRAVSDEGILTRFTFKARGTIAKHGDETISKARFVKWETVSGHTEKTSTVNISAIEPI